ncbi:Bug family tripartite tricarboxylate transporter substrate binding protein [Xylophilus sp.]|uniref:Bug family tripartite tricarboxylate transporter substrate binding protein n=1 Tax=Xylophilus sp. TaxID=2653893 RepID=UPI0013B8BE33|nr:tripartite tricarboxylate transporter substrate binding protein [Xylophilus sp.]KAF1046743.1 MAG: hypothetical protein GAK38_02306 [Xylophilus sp.]
MRQRRHILIALACALAAAGGTTAAAGYPAKPVRLLVHFPAGSSTDVIARVLADKVSAKLGQPIVVDNKPGADGAIAATELKRSAPDGYTLLLATNSPMSGVPAMKKAPPFDPVKDFTPITDVGRYTFLVYVNAAVPAKTLPEFVAYARSKPGQLSYAAGNVTGLLSFAAIAQQSRLDMTQVPYRGEPPAITDLVGGRIDAMVATAGTGLPHVQSGRLRALATILPKRGATLPDVPTVQESGFPDFSIAPWAGLFGPAGMPRDVVAVLNREFGAAMKQPDVIRKLAEQEFALSPSTPEALGALVRRQLDVHRDILRSAGIEPE